jgi:uncharacterized caspase-like protein
VRYDATAIAKLIRDIGFDVVDFRHDLVGTELRHAKRRFTMIDACVQRRGRS